MTHQPLSHRYLTIIFLCFSLFNNCLASASLPDIDLSTATFEPTKTGFTIVGEGTGDYFGLSVGTAGDFNGDGYDDFIIGAPYKDVAQGKVYVVYGGKTSSFFDKDLSSLSLDPATTGFTISGKYLGSYFGQTSGTAGDINGDGYADIIIGAHSDYFGQGAAYVIYGGRTSLMKDIDLSLTDLDPKTTGFTLKGRTSGGNFGTAKAAGDVNGDGYDDIIIGATDENNGQGTAYVIYGGKTSSMKGIDFSVTALDPKKTGFTITGKDQVSLLGSPASTPGDVNGDGYDDIIIGASYENNSQGAAYVIYGGKTSSMKNIDLSVTTLDPATTGFAILGETTTIYFGLSSSIVDINNDGYADILIASSLADTSRGFVYVIYGKATSSSSNIALDTPLDPAITGFIIKGNAIGDQLGISLSKAGDINGDGYNDMIIGAQIIDNRGRVYVLYGGKISSFSNIDLSSATPLSSSKGFIISGTNPGDYLGRFVSPGGDVNSDGYQDIIVGVAGYNSGQGSVYIIHNACVLSSPSGTCVERQFCEACDQGTNAGNSGCKVCPTNCQEYSGSKTCKVCDQGYLLSSESHCVLPSSSSSTSKSVASQIISSVVSFFGSVVCIGKSYFLRTGMISKLVQYTRYIDLMVSDELKEMYENWNTDLLSWNFPDSLSYLLIHFKTQPIFFSRYDFDSPFLANFWSNLMVIGISLGVFTGSHALKRYMNRVKNKGAFQTTLKRLIDGSWNFLLVQIYGCADDILFYFVLDARANYFDTAFSRTSFVFGLIFVLLGGFLIFFNIRIVKKYQKVKKESIEKNDDNALGGFIENNKNWELFFADFNDENFWSHSFLATLVLRSCLSSLIIGVFYNYRLLQTITLLILDVTIIILLIRKKPFLTLRDKFAQYYFEIIALLVHICVLALSIQGHRVASSDNFKIKLSSFVVYLNAALVAGTMGFMFIELYKTISHKIKEWKAKRNQNLAVHPVVEENSNAHVTTTQPINLTTDQCLTIQTNRDQPERKQQVTENPLENLDEQSVNNNTFMENSIQRMEREPDLMVVDISFQQDDSVNVNVTNVPLDEEINKQFLAHKRIKNLRS